MVRMQVAGLLALVILGACSNPGATPSPISDTDPEIYMAVLEHVAEENRGIAYPRTVVPFELVAKPPSTLLALMEVDSVDLGRFNDAGHPIPAGVSPVLNKKQTECFHDAECDFYRSRADTSWSAVITFSVPVFDTGGKALMYYEYRCGRFLCAGGSWLVLDRVDGEWSVVDSRVVWRS